MTTLVLSLVIGTILFFSSFNFLRKFFQELGEFLELGWRGLSVLISC